MPVIDTNNWYHYEDWYLLLQLEFYTCIGLQAFDKRQDIKGKSCFSLEIECTVCRIECQTQEASKGDCIPFQLAWKPDDRLDICALGNKYINSW